MIARSGVSKSGSGTRFFSPLGSTKLSLHAFRDKETFTFTCIFNPLNAELNTICHLLALLGGATIVVVSRLRVKQTARQMISNAVAAVFNLLLIRLVKLVRYFKNKCTVRNLVPNTNCYN